MALGRQNAACDDSGRSTAPVLAGFSQMPSTVSSHNVWHLFPASGCKNTVFTSISDVRRVALPCEYTPYGEEPLRGPCNKKGTHNANKYTDKVLFDDSLGLQKMTNIYWAPTMGKVLFQVSILLSVRLHLLLSRTAYYSAPGTLASLFLKPVRHVPDTGALCSCSLGLALSSPKYIHS